MGPFSQSQWPSWAYSDMSDQFSSYSQFSNYPSYLADSLETYQTHQNCLVQHQQQMSRTTESKPRLSKDEVEILEAEFQKNHKPSSSTKKTLAESMRVDNARINNWFQNRRAREKKENNMREYEAQQRLEKEQAESGEGCQPEKSCQRDLVASSAPFPQPASTQRYLDASQSPSEQSVSDQTSDSGLISPLPFSSIKEEHAAEDDYFSPLGTSMLNAHTNLASREFFTQLSGSEHIQQSVEGYDNQDVDFSASSSPVADDSDIASPCGINIASRRNRRPAPLSIAGGRSKSYTAARANDALGKGDKTIAMRRVSSSASTARVTKSVATPRSPFSDRNSVGFFNRRTSPHAAGRRASAAPPTPDTPVTLQPQESMGVPNLYTLNGKYTPEGSLADPTLRTPPTTPGFSDGLFNLGLGAYESSISDEVLVTPGLGRLQTSMAIASNPAMFANYISNSQRCLGQQPAPMYSLQMDQSYFGYGGNDGNSDYSWSNLSPSTASTSSNIQHRYLSLNDNMDS